MRSAVFCLLFLALIALGVQGGHVRLVHLSIPTSTVSISFNGTAKVVDAPFKETSEYFELTDGVYLVELTINGGETTVHINQTVTVNGYWTYVAEGQQKPSLARYQDAFYRPDVAAGKSIIRFLDAIEGDLVFDLSLNDTKIASNLGYTKMTDYFSVSEPALNVTAGNTFGSFSTIVPITRGIAYTTFIYGTAVAPGWFAIVDFDYRKPTVRVVQASPDAASLSVSVGGVAFPSLSFSSQSSYQEVPKGVQLVNVTGDKGLVFNTPDLVALKAYTVVIYGFVNPPAGNSNGLAGEVLLDAPSDPNTATVRFGNLVPDSSTFLVEFNGKNFTTFYGYLNSTFSLDTNDTQVYSIKVYNSTNKLGKRHWRRSLNDYTTILTTSITVSKGTLYTVFIEGSGSNIRVVADNQPAPNPDNGSSGLSSGAIAGIVIGSIFGAILLVGLIVYCYRRSKYQSIP